jgi:hypothetical protein
MPASRHYAEPMSSAAVADIAIGILVLALVLYRQLTTQRLRENYRLPLILAIIGIVQFAAFLRGHPRDDGGIATAVAGSLVIAAAFGAVRALTVRVWRQDGVLLRRGTWVTAVLWVISFAAHLGYDYLIAGNVVSGKNGSSVGDATVLLYLVVTLTVQRYLLMLRAERQEAAGRLATEDS